MSPGAVINNLGAWKKIAASHRYDVLVDTSSAAAQSCRGPFAVQRLG